MARYDLLQDQAAAGPGPWVAVRPGVARSIQIVIAGGATVDIEASNNAKDPVSLQAGVAASTGYTDTDPWLYVRANKTNASGTASVIMGAP